MAVSRPRFVTVFLSILVIFSCVTRIDAQSLEPIRYTVTFSAPHTHYVEIDALYPTETRPYLELMMAVWTPGSYLIREYERHVEGLVATDSAGRRLVVEKTRKNRWRVSTAGARTVRVRYRVYAHEMSVRTNWVDDELALLNGAPTFITIRESPSVRAHEVRVVLPRAWSRSLSAMPPGTGPNTYIADNYDTLVDSPIVAGSPSVYEFDVQGKPHYLVNFRERGVWNGPQAVQDLARIANTIATFWGTMPFDRYYFFNVIGAARNGLEHKFSTVLNTPTDSTKGREAYLEWLSLASHEYFHAWNGKRLRPVELGPFDYENEVYTKSLWFVEGVTDYYADLMLARAGVTALEEFLRALSAQIRDLQSTPGRLEQSVEMASYDAWIKYYRADENTPNSAISYYVKGAVVAFLLDARIQRLTRGTQSLDDVLRRMWWQFSAEKGFTGDDIRRAILNVLGANREQDMAGWLERTLETAGELAYTEAIDWFGLRITPPTAAGKPWIGVTTRVDDNRTIVSAIRRDSPAATAGMSLLDEIVAINGEPFPPGEFDQRLSRFAAGAKVTLTISRTERTRPVEVVLAADPGQAWQLSVAPGATAEQIKSRLVDWLSPK